MAQTLDLGRVVGEQGPKGDKGDAGERGPKGDKGDPGEQGPKGERGTDGVMMRRLFALSFPAAGWTEQTDGSFTQQADAEGVLESDYAHIDIDMSTVTRGAYADINKAWALVSRAQTQKDGLLLTCFGSAPTVELPVKMEVIR